MRSSFANLFLVSIVPGNGSKEPENLDPHVEILVNELLSLANATIYDAYLKSSFQMKFHVLSYVLDYPGMGKLFRTMGSGAYLGCMWCDLRGIILCALYICIYIIMFTILYLHVGTRNPHLQKMIYLQNRRFLNLTSELRTDATNFPAQLSRIAI